MHPTSGSTRPLQCVPALTALLMAAWGMASCRWYSVSSCLPLSALWNHPGTWHTALTLYTIAALHLCRVGAGTSLEGAGALFTATGSIPSLCRQVRT